MNRFLLGVLWLVAVVLCACFWFNVRFGFDLFSKAHWGYFATAQVGPAPVSIWFYISFVVFALVGVAGLYLLMRTTSGRTTMQHPPALLPAPATFDKAAETAPMLTAMPVAGLIRPPNPGLVSGMLYTSQPDPVVGAAPTPIIPAAPTVPRTVRTPSPETRFMLQKSVTDGGFLLKKGPVIDGLDPDIWAMGTDEVLLIGVICPVGGDITAAEGGKSLWKSSDGATFDSPVWQLVNTVQKLQNLFADTLEDITINTRPFVVMDGGVITNIDRVKSIWDAFGVAVFPSISAFDDYMRENPNRPVPDDERGDFEAYVEYIDTVTDFFNKEKVTTGGTVPND